MPIHFPRLSRSLTNSARWAATKNLKMTQFGGSSLQEHSIEI